MTDAAPVLVTGAGGFVGRAVVAELRGRGAGLAAVEHRWQTIAEVETLARAHRVTRCIHLGWYAGPADYLTAEEPNRRSLHDSLELVAALGRIGVEHLVVAGSAAEYAASDGPVDEDARVEPWSTYGRCKAALHASLQQPPPGMQVAWARLFNVAGPGEHPDRLVPWVARSVLAGAAVELSPGDQVRDFLDVADVAAALVALSDARAEGTFNVSSGVGVPLREFLTHVGEAAGAPELLLFGARPYAENERMVAVGHNGRIVAATGWRPRYGPEEIARRAVAYWASRA